MPIRVLPDYLINQIAAGEVVENPASVVKELVENALDAGATEIVVDVVDGGRTRIDVIDNGAGMTRDDLQNAVRRHATSKLPDDDLLNINFMGFRGEALPSIASVSDMTIDTFNAAEKNGWKLNATTGDVAPCAWDSGTRVRVENLFAKTPARLKFLRGDRAELMDVLSVIKRLALARVDVGFTLNNKWRFARGAGLIDRISAVMGDDVAENMIAVDATSGTNSDLKLSGYISVPTLRRASSVDQFLFVNGRPVRDRVFVGALRAAYMDVMHAREFPLCALYLTINPRHVDVNVSPAKTDVHFLEPSHVRAFIIKNLRERLAVPMSDVQIPEYRAQSAASSVQMGAVGNFMRFGQPVQNYEKQNSSNITNMLLRLRDNLFENNSRDNIAPPTAHDYESELPLGRVIGQFGNKYILAARGDTLVIVDQHAAHERITYERLRRHAIKSQPLLTPIVVNLRAEDVTAILSIADELRASGLTVDAFGDDAIAISEKPADWDMDWVAVLRAVADEVRANGHSSGLNEKLHLKLANYACHHSVRAGQRLDMAQMNTLLRDIENTTRGGECNHGRPVYHFIPMRDIDRWFER